MFSIEPKDLFEIHSISEDSDFRDYVDTDPTGLKIISLEYPGCNERVLYSEAGDFEKWIRKSKPEINIEVEKVNRKLVLQSGDYWLPLVFLASDVTLPIYLNIVASYLYDKIKGALKGEKPRVHFSAVYQDELAGVTKKVEFEGDIDALSKIITKININKLLND
ncbi:MAG: hypothetical protein V1792_24395 [Pseudomonadota bacterium]